jgi:diguanylate cyclase (GGDEF)-like protein
MVLMCGTCLCIVLLLGICLPQLRQLRGALVMAATMSFFLLMSIGGFWELSHLVSAPTTRGVLPIPKTILALDLVLSVVVNLAFLLILIELLQQRIERLSVTDPLTAVLNRRGFLQAANLQLLHTDRRRGAHRAASVLLLDLDHFKRINDSLGHPMGDAVLRGAAERVAASVRQTDVLARWGGEEFVALLPGTRLAQAREVAERIRQAVASAPLADGAPIVTVSIGAASLEDVLAVDQLPALIADADRRLYLAKRWRNCVVDQDDGAGRLQASPAEPPASTGKPVRLADAVQT